MELFLTFETHTAMDAFIEESDYNYLEIVQQYETIPVLLVKCKNVDGIKKLEINKDILQIENNFRCYLSQIALTEFSEKDIVNYCNRTKETLGQGITIALLDSGIDTSVSNLKKRVISKIDVTKEPWEDSAGHGTLMAGIITEIVPKVDLIDVKISPGSGLLYASDVLLGLDKVYSIKVDIIAIGVSSPTITDGKDIITRMCGMLAENSVIFVTPAGNFGPESNTIGFNSHLPQSFCIGSINAHDKVSFFSSRGEDKPDFFIMGEKVTSNSSFHGILGKPHSTRSEKRIVSGTSVSAMKFAGILAMILHTFPDFKHEDVLNFLNSFHPNSRQIQVEEVKDKLFTMRPEIKSYKSVILISSLITLIIGIIGIGSVFLFR